MFSNTNKLEKMTEQRRTCMRLLLKLLNRIYETQFCNDKLLGWTRTCNVGGLLFATRRYDIVTIIVLELIDNTVRSITFNEINTFVQFEFLHGHIQDVNILDTKTLFTPF